MRRLLALLVGISLLAALAASSAPAKGGPEIIPLPQGWQPEGIAVGRGSTFYVGSLANRGIFRGDLRTGEGEVLVENVFSVGLSVDKRSNYVFAAGGPNGDARVYDGGSGDLIASYQLVAPATSPFINDVIVTRDAAYFTNSAAAFLYRIPIGPGGSVDPAATPEAIPLTGGWNQVAGFNANGIEATSDGTWLIVVNSTVGEIYRVDPESGSATLIDLGGAAKLVNGDGLLLKKKTLYVVQNQLNQIAVVDLAEDLLTGTVSATITNPAFDVPTTIASFKRKLYAVNAKFGNPDPPAAPYEIVRAKPAKNNKKEPSRKDGRHFEASLTGSEEVPPVETKTSGEATFAANKDETEIAFRLEIRDATDILGAVGAHIHCAPAGQNGPVVAFLAGMVPGGFDGEVELEATLTGANIVSAECGATIAELLQSMRDGKTYVNVHSVANPTGEIRGQITANGDSGKDKSKDSVSGDSEGKKDDRHGQDDSEKHSHSH